MIKRKRNASSSPDSFTHQPPSYSRPALTTQTHTTNQITIMKQPLLLFSLLSLAAVVVQADDVVAPWNKLIRDGVVKNKISTSDTSRIMAM